MESGSDEEDKVDEYREGTLFTGDSDDVSLFSLS